MQEKVGIRRIYPKKAIMSLLEERQMGELKNCPVCGKVFVKIVKNLCPDCVEAEEKEFLTVREYIKENPGASVEEISVVTEIDEKKILRWLREGRIEYSSRQAGIKITCKSCGAPISVGNLCGECARELSDKLHSMSRQDKSFAKSNDDEDPLSKRMFVANRLRKGE